MEAEAVVEKATGQIGMERKAGLGPATFSLAWRRATVAPLPHDWLA